MLMAMAPPALERWVLGCSAAHSTRAEGRRQRRGPAYVGGQEEPEKYVGLDLLLGVRRRRDQRSHRVSAAKDEGALGVGGDSSH